MAKKRNNRTITANDTVLLIDQALLLDVTTGAFQLELPDSTVTGIEPGYIFYFIPIAGDFTTNHVTLVPNATDGTTVNGSASLVMSSNDVVILELIENGDWTSIITRSGSSLPLAEGSGPFSILLDNALNNIASGDYSLAYGSNVTASAWSGVALGYQTKAIATNLSMAINWATEASGNQSFAQGLRSKASGANSSSFGKESEASGENAMSSGWKTKATAYAATSRGLESEARAQGAYAEGSGSIAGIADGGLPDTGSYSHAQNLYTQATGDASHAGGAGVFNGGDTKRVAAAGYAAFNHSEVDDTDDGIGAAARASAILGGLNNKILDAAIQSVVLGGKGLIGAEPDFVYVPNFEIQIGIGQYKIDPTTQPTWGDRSIPDKAYIDQCCNPVWTADPNLNVNLTFTKYQSGVITADAEINLSLNSGSVRYLVIGKIAYVNFDLLIDAENISVATNNLNFTMILAMPDLPSDVAQEVHSSLFTISANEIPGPNLVEFQQSITAKPSRTIDFGRYTHSINAGQRFEVKYQGQLFFELT